jgi:replication factor C small subunit
MTVSAIWDIQFRPAKLENYVFKDEQQKSLIESFIVQQNIPNLLLFGHRGTGKTSLALLLKTYLKIDDVDFMTINGSDENGVDVMRNKVKNFVSSISSSAFKIVFIDEADYLSQEAQAILRNMLETYADNARFIFTCNKIGKIIPELRSRCVEISFPSLDKEDIIEKLLIILQKNKIKVNSLEDVESHVTAHYPDMRKMILSIQQASKSGTLESVAEGDENLESFVKIVSFIETENWDAARKYISESFSKDSFEECYKFLYSYLHEIQKFTDNNKWKSGIVIIADHLYKHSLISDPEINFLACLIRLCNI